MAIDFEFIQDPGDLVVTDLATDTRATLRFGGAYGYEETDSDELLYPVDRAARLQADAISLESTDAVYLRDEDGKLVASPNQDNATSFAPGTYILEANIGVRLYIRIEAEREIQAAIGPEKASIAFNSPTTLIIGARSTHHKPEATITTTEHPEDIRKAISYLGSSLKTTSPERSWPTLRGHPPRIELGESLEIPDSVSIPNEDVWLEIPESIPSLLVAAPLAFYLGCEIRSGTTPQVATCSGFRHQLVDSEAGYETAVEQCLKQLFVLDCITRTEGLYEISLSERELIESRVEFDYQTLYDAPLKEQIEEYLSVPYSAIEDAVPTWGTSVFVEGTALEAETIPYALDDLSVVRTADSSSVSTASASGEDLPQALASDDSDSSIDRTSLVEIDHNDIANQSHEQAWLGTGIALNMHSRSKQAYENRIAGDPAKDALDINLVVNDPETLLNLNNYHNLYDSNTLIRNNISIHQDVTTSELEAILQEEDGFLQFEGHITEEGFHCTDGVYDATELEDLSIDVFFLNASTSYQQGVELINCGAAGGIVTLSDVINSTALQIGRDIGKLLSRGFPIGSALELATTNTVTELSYIQLGCNTQTDTRSTPAHLEIDSSQQPPAVALQSYPSSIAGMGAIHTYGSDSLPSHHLISARVTGDQLSYEDLNDLVLSTDMPAIVDGKLTFGEISESVFPEEGSNDSASAEAGQELVSELNRIHVFSDSHQEKLCQQFSDLYEGRAISEISPTELISIVQVAHVAESLGQEYLTSTASHLEEELHETYQDHPLATSNAEDEEELTPGDARQVITSRRGHLQQFAKNVFGSDSPEIIDELQWAYLCLIWDLIDFNPEHADAISDTQLGPPSESQTYTV